MKYHVNNYGELKRILTPDDGDIAVCHNQKYKVYRYDADEEAWIRDLEEESIIKPQMEAEDEIIALLPRETK